MYRIAKRLPAIEKFGFGSQVRRALSLTNNIAEGHGRYHYLEQIKFTLQSRRSLEELIDDLNVCEDEQYLPVQEIRSLKREGWRVRQLIDGYLRYLRGQKNSRGFSSVQEPPSDNELTEDEVMTCSPIALTLHRFNSSTNENSHLQNLAR